MNLQEFFTSVCENKHANIDWLVNKVYQMYSGREYHNLRHIQECITVFNNLCKVVPELQCDRLTKLHPDLDLDLIKLAIIFHDIVHDPKRDDNIERSVALTQRLMKEILGLENPMDLDMVCVMIEMTSHSQRDYNILYRNKTILKTYYSAAIVCDCDLAILAAPQERFDEYEQQIRQEWSHVPDEEFNEKRSQIMLSFLKRPTIYLNNQMCLSWEKLARKNLEKYNPRVNYPIMER